jgi:hypothetical protein
MSVLHEQRLIVFTAACALLAGAGIVAPPVHAHTSAQTAKQTPIANFDTFLDAHPAIEKDLKQNPSLVNDATYLSNHPELKTFLAGNAAVSAAATKDPKALMNRLQRFEKSGRDISKADRAAFDKFLDQHSTIAKDIRKDPALLTNASYLASHPDLQSFLAANPGIQQEITEHPRGFVNAENHFEHHEDNGEHQQAKIQHPNAPTPPPHPMGHR